jgi:hypothetical protein
MSMSPAIELHLRTVLVEASGGHLAIAPVSGLGIHCHREQRHQRKQDDAHKSCSPEEITIRPDAIVVELYQPAFTNPCPGKPLE